MRISEGKISLENRVIDLSTFQIRPKISEQDLERHYDSFIFHVQEIGDYFEDTVAFDKAVNDAAHDKRPKLVARKIKVPHCMTCIPRKEMRIFQKIAGRIQVSETKNQLYEELIIDKIPDLIVEKFSIPNEFKQYPGYEGIIEIPNDKTQAQTKGITFHEALHYVIARYDIETEKSYSSELKRKQAEEEDVGILTDKLLIHDPDAQFEKRWLHYSLNDRFRYRVMNASYVATMIILVGTIVYPPLFPLALVPGRIRDYTLKRHKQSKKEEVLRAVEYPKFKI